MQPLYNIAQIQQLEQLAIKKMPLSIMELMQRAGEAAFNCLLKKWPKTKNIIVICGKGNNGGDGYVLAKIAQQKKYIVTVYQLAAIEELQGVAIEAAKAAIAEGVSVKPFNAEGLLQADVIVDAIFGIGLRRDLDSEKNAVITAINQAQKPVLAIDIPSGLNADTGSAYGGVIKATVTCTFIGLKQGLFTGQAAEYCGEIICDSLGISEVIFAEIKSITNLINKNSLAKYLPKRSRTANKGNYGHVLVVGGDYGMAGAAIMAARAAARVGAGLVSVATRPEHVLALNIIQPEIMGHGIQNTSELVPLLKKATVVAIGPGLGKSLWATELLKLALNDAHPKVADADALNLLSEQQIKNDNWILTPHPGEAGRLLDCTNQEIQADRFLAIKKIQRSYGGVCVLKGAGSLITDGKQINICTTGNPGMATGGMGDILTGVIAGLLAQQLDLLQAAQLGVWLHGQAADSAAMESGERGLLATDLLPYLHKLINDLF